LAFGAEERSGSSSEVFEEALYVGWSQRSGLSVAPNRYMALNVDGRSFHGISFLPFSAAESDQSFC